MIKQGFIELRCLDSKCGYSGYVRVALFEDRIHHCPLCLGILVSEIDVNVFSLLLETGIPTEDYS